MRLALLPALFLSLTAWSAAAADTPADPLGSPVWRDVAKAHFGDAPIAFDARVKVVLPSIVEDQAQVPVTVDARGIAGVRKVVVLADLNPIRQVATLTPRRAEPYVSLRMKVEQATPVRAAVLTADGVWRIGGAFLDAAGGGCSAPAAARKDADWASTVGQAQGRLWREVDGAVRLRFRVRHPMDTGLGKDNTPAYFIQEMAIASSGGEALADLELFEPVSEDPTFTLLVRLPAGEGGVGISGRDNNGGLFRATLAVPSHHSAAGPERSAP
jgi:sulfur-oxidizing protein SoxY